MRNGELPDKGGLAWPAGIDRRLLGAGVAWSHPARGLTGEVRTRGLLAHETQAFNERGFSGALSFDPTPGAQGLSHGDPERGRSGFRRGGRAARPGLGAGEEGDAPEARRLDGRVGYGFSVFGAQFVSTPEIGLSLS